MLTAESSAPTLKVPPAGLPFLQEPTAARHPFDRAITTDRTASDAFIAEVSPEWNVFRGPNGGFLAALLLGTMVRRVDDPSRRPRVLSAHYPSVPKFGTVEIRTRIERVGRSVTWISAELWQGNVLCVAGRSAFSTEWAGIEYDALARPPMPAPDKGIPRFPGMPPMTDNFEYRSFFANPVEPKTHSDVGGYIRAKQPRRFDAPLLAAVSDAWFPSTFAHDGRFVMAATLDLTVHFRSYAALERLPEDAFVMSVFRSELAAEGFFEEDGTIWSPEGVLLAQSRQLAIATPM